MYVRQNMFQFNDARDWFFRARFGMFVHWGIYSINGWHEQEQYRRGMGRSEYRRIASRFNPRAFNPDKWIDLAEQSGMRYIVLTAKHIDGFCMFDSAVSDFKITNTPFKKDIVGMLADACHRRNFHFGVYLSALDNLLYVHLIEEPKTASVILNPVNILPVRATLLNTGEPVCFDLNRLPVLHMEPVKTALRLYGLPVERLANELPVIKLEFDHPVKNWPVGTVAGKETETALK